MANEIVEPNLNTDDIISDFNIKHNFVRNDYSTNQDVIFYPKNNQNQDDILIEKRISSGVAVVHLITENLLSHPFIVLRRQCQVNHIARKYHLLPHSLLPVLYGLHKEQGLGGLWKGLGSVLIVKGISLGVQDLISKVTPWPKEINALTSLKKFCHHILLKCTSLAIATPFCAASFVETVQSELASDRPEIWEVFNEGFMRLLIWTNGNKGRMIPIWALILPTVALGLSKYLFTMIVRGCSLQLLYFKYRQRHEANGALPKDIAKTAEIQDIQLTASLIANIATDVVFYPFETIIHRLYLQGTKTIVDNLDNGRSVIPLLTNFTGLVDCYNYCIEKEGKTGLYKGFGVLIMQYTVHIALLKFSRFLLRQLSHFIPKPKQTTGPITGPVVLSPVALSNLSIIHRSYLLP